MPGPPYYTNPTPQDNQLDDWAFAFRPWMNWVALIVLQVPGVILGLLMMLRCQTNTGRAVGARLLGFSFVGFLLAAFALVGFFSVR